MPLTGAVGSADWGWKVTDSESPSSFFIYTPVYIKNELSSLPRGHLILTT